MTGVVSGEQGAERVEEIKLALPALTAYARVARLAVSGLAAQVGFSYDEIEDLRIAVGEVCSVLLDDMLLDHTLLDHTGSRLTFRCELTHRSLAVEASRQPVGEPGGVAEMTRQILDAVVDEAEIDLDRAQIRFLKRRQA